MKRIVSLIPLALLLSSAISLAQGSLVITYAEGPDEVNSTLSNTMVFTFNDLATDTTHQNVVWTGVGEFDQLRILSADSYGGAVDSGYANGSPYSVQGFAGVNTTTLTLDSPHAYFGFWWSAGDSQNVLEFYNGSTLMATFSSATLLDVLATTHEYRGNPRDRNLNYGENYAFINFFGQDGATWDRIVFSNGGGTGFESDNYTDRAAAWSYETDGPMPGHVLTTVNTPPTTAVPEVKSSVLGLLGITFFLLRRRA